MRIERGEFFCRAALLRGRGAIGRADRRAGRQAGVKGRKYLSGVELKRGLVGWEGGWTGGRERSMLRGNGEGQRR